MSISTSTSNEKLTLVSELVLALSVAELNIRYRNFAVIKFDVKRIQVFSKSWLNSLNILKIELIKQIESK